MSLYLILLLVSLVVPFSLSFEKKLQFWKQWKYLFPSIFMVASYFILFDIYLTSNGVWGFNPKYHLNINILNLPLEEWLFFIVIPYSSIFLHDSFILYFPTLKLKRKHTFLLTSLLILFLLIVLIFNYQRSYTLFIFLTLISVLIISISVESTIINHFYITFLLILVPLIIVNSILTGTFIQGEVFWYNKDEILNLRVLTIPVEDIGFAFSHILLILIIREKLVTYFQNKKV